MSFVFIMFYFFFRLTWLLSEPVTQTVAWKEAQVGKEVRT
jgi:hypothetical protein